MSESGLVWFVLSAVLLPILTNEFVELCPWLAERLIRWAIGRFVPPEFRARAEEELLGLIEDTETPGKVAKLCRAITVAFYTPDLSRAYRGLPPLKQEVQGRLAGWVLLATHQVKQWPEWLEKRRRLSRNSPGRLRRPIRVLLRRVRRDRVADRRRINRTRPPPVVVPAI